ncbi:hypothetical protein HYFRA_00006251 [Hymenoscyphus fraxineus]|uniref:Uncharacterized protein n=1 Tax=Hymenoscyphus fraxineus TaxID=746836 RepID=A0A9N9LAX4_9HELO|nr:hypothetical protein HYFRA_00006251 [Hymenoscyphus fraxineus]
MVKNFQFVWPKDGPKGKSGHRGFFGRLNNVITNRGPDVFLQRKGDKTPIKPDEWGNWDSYTNPNAQLIENTQQYVSRGNKRYDPHTRRYKSWAWDNDYRQQGPDGLGPGYYPHFTALEYGQMDRTLNRGHRIDPSKMGRDWNQYGPKRFRQEHDWFWQEAHRVAENRRENLPDWYDVNQNFQMHQCWPSDLNDWAVTEGLGIGRRRGRYRWP